MNSEKLQLVTVASIAGGTAIPIAYRFAEPQGNKPVFIWFCGFKSDMDSLKAAALAEWAIQNGAGCLRFDYSGHGRSGGRFEEGTITAWLGQALALHSRVLQAGEAVFVGSSMGGWIALLLARALIAAGGPAPKGIVLIAPAWDMTRLMWERAPQEARDAVLRDGVYYRPSAYSPEPYAISRALIEDGERHLFGDGPVPIDAPVRILHGCQDPDVPWRHSLDLLDAIACPDMRLTLIKDGEHRLSRPQDLDLLFAALGEFLPGLSVLR
jgi:alpha-beta hydrolase superfamily lysophospholipase